MKQQANLITSSEEMIDKTAAAHPDAEAESASVADGRDQLIEPTTAEYEPEAPGEEELKIEASNRVSGDDDPVQFYLRDMSVSPLLTREGEIRLARRIEGGQRRVWKTISRSPIVIEDLIALAAPLKRGEMNIRDVVCFSDSEEVSEEATAERLAVTLDLLSFIKKAHARTLKLAERITQTPKRSSARLRRRLARARIEISRAVLDLNLTVAERERLIALIRSAAAELRQAKKAVADSERAIAQIRRNQDPTSLKRDLRQARRQVSEVEKRWRVSGAELERSLALINRGEAEAQIARNDMIEANLRLVLSIARKYTGRGLAFSDLVQEGNIGLMKAVERYDWRLGCKFSTYGTWWIRQAIMRAIMDYGRVIRIPVHMMELVSKQIHATRALEQEMERAPDPEEIAERMQVPVAKVRAVLELVSDPVSLETPVGEDDTRLSDFIEDGSLTCSLDDLIQSDLKEATQEALKRLTPREEKVIKMRFGLGPEGREHTLEEVGEYFDVTRERVRQIEARALDKLRQPARAGKLRSFAPGAPKTSRIFYGAGAPASGSTATGSNAARRIS